jgi:hypothetical protein
MSTTPNLLLSHIAAAQNQKEVTANAGLDGLDEAFNSLVQITMSNADYTFATGAGSPFFANFFFQFIGANSAARSVNLPTGSGRFFGVQDKTTPAPSSTQGLTFKVGTHVASVSITDGLPHLLYSDGVGTIYLFI